MVLTESTQLPLGTTAPSFTLPDVTTGENISLEALTADALVVMFICNHCPYVVHIREGLAALGADYKDKSVALVAISSNDTEKYPQDSPEKMKEEAASAGYSFPYLFDETQEVAKAYQAACTPDFFVFGRDRKLVYRGRLDESRPGSEIPVTGQELRAAIDGVLGGAPPVSQQFPSMGCNIKWKPGNAPSYFG